MTPLWLFPVVLSAVTVAGIALLVSALRAAARWDDAHMDDDDYRS